MYQLCASVCGFPLTDEDCSFKEVLFYGNEAILLSFEILIFCIIDLRAHSVVFAAVLKYIEQMVSKSVLQHI